ncbi:MAG: hypothetical protein JW863_01135 [Chitinispirillaceae bacterium]|nr:hypothetical protein [Chitinispirillaceae bacterium]
MDELNEREEQLPEAEDELIGGLREVHHTQSKFGSLTLLIVTIILFFSAEIVSTRWQDVLILIGVIFFHELGHFLAMKLLRYDDVKMFFLPFLGAAVSGKAKKETALKSCIVSLMGPFPGIIVGAILFTLYFLTHNYFLLKTAQVMLLLNAFNFLPIMPLDGGRFLDVLFVRRRVFRLLFALLGAMVFLGLAVSSQDIFIGIIGVFSVTGAIAGFKIHGIATTLASKGLNVVSVDELLDNPDQLNIMIDEMKRHYGKLFTPNVIYKSIYSNMTVIVDTLKFIPAGIVSKIVLIMAYPLLLLVSITIAFFFLAADVKETAVHREEAGGNTVYAEWYWFGKVVSRIPLNSATEYHGTGIGFGNDTTRITDTYRYENGVRTGTWVTTNDTGDTIQKNIYNNGKLLMKINRTEDAWDTIPARELPLFHRAMATLREISQPVRSNHEYFE